jgi:peptide/nickel transport system substrate-binding protein
MDRSKSRGPGSGMRPGWFHAVRGRVAVAVVAMVFLGIAISACGSSGGSSSSASSSSGGETAEGGGKGGTLTIATPSAPPSLDPATGANEYSDYFNLAYEPLIIETPEGTFKPGLAKSWKYGPNNESFEIELKPGIKFSDGTPLDAKAVKTWIEHEMKLPGGRGPTYLESLESTEVTGPLSVTLKFGEPTPLLELVFSQSLEMGMIGSPKAVAANKLDTETAGAGEYMLEPKSTVTGSEYVYVPNPNYGDKGAVHWEKVVIKAIESPTAALQALRTGQIQLAKDQPPTSLAAAESSGIENVAPVTLLLGLNLVDREGKVSPLGNPKVRQAINYAIDREAIANVIGAGKGEPVDQMAVKGDDSYDESLADHYEYNPEKAEELLAEAGYSNGIKIKTLVATVVEQEKLAEAIAGQLEKVGIKLELDVRSNIGDFFTKLGSDEYPAATIGFGRLPAAILYKLLWGPNAVPFNPFKTKSPQLAKLDKELGAASGAEATKIAQEMQAYTVEEAWLAPVVAVPLVDLYSSDITGVTATDQRNVIYTPEIEPAE